MAAHRYWRFRNSTGTTGNAGYFTAVRIGFFPNKHEAGDVAPLASVTSDAFYTTGYEATKAVDGNNSTYFQHSSTNNGWIQLDFGAGKAYDLDHFDWTLDGYGNGVNGPKDIQVEWSDDGSIWTLLWANTGLTWIGSETKAFSNPVSPPARNPTTGAHRYWRLLVHAVGDMGNWVAIGELKGIDRIVGPQVLTGGTASTNHAYAAPYTADKAFNGSFDTGWVADAFTDGAWIAYDLGVGNAKDIQQITITSRSDGYSEQSPVSFEWQWSDDNVTWNTKFGGNLPRFTYQAQSQSYPYLYPAPNSDYAVAATAVESLDAVGSTAQLAQIAVESLEATQSQTTIVYVAGVGLEVLRSTVDIPTLASAAAIGVESLDTVGSNAQVGAIGIEVLRSVSNAAPRRRPLYLD